MNLFTSAGMVVQLPADSQLLGIYLQDIYDPNGSFNFGTRRAIITSMATQESSLFQLRNMFNDKWYINVFGDNPGIMTISGMFAGGDCDTVLFNGVGETSGFELVSTYYRQHRLSNRLSSLPVAIGGFFNAMIYEAFLTECQVGAVDPQLQIGQFSMKLVYPMSLSNDLEGDGGGGDFPDTGDFPNPPDEPQGPSSPGDPANTLLP